MKDNVARKKDLTQRQNARLSEKRQSNVWAMYHAGTEMKHSGLCSNR